MILYFSDRRRQIEIKDEDKQLFSIVSSFLNFAGEVPENLREQYTKFASGLKMISYGLNQDDAALVESGIRNNGFFRDYQDFLSKNINENENVCQFIYNKIEDKAKLDTLFKKISTIFNVKIDLAELGVNRGKLQAEAVQQVDPEVQKGPQWQIKAGKKEIKLTPDDLEKKLGDLAVGELSSILKQVGGKIQDKDEELCRELAKYANALSLMSRAVEEGKADKKTFQYNVDKFISFGNFLKMKWGSERTVIDIIRENISPEPYNGAYAFSLKYKNPKEAFDGIYKGLDEFLGLAGAEKQPDGYWKGTNTNELEGIHAPEAFVKAIENVDPNPEDVYSLPDYLEDALRRGFQGKDLDFLKNVYECTSKIPGAFSAQYLKDMFRNEEMGREQIIDLAASFVHRNHVNTEEYVKNEQAVVKYFNDTFKDTFKKGRAALEVPVFNPEKKDEWKKHPAKLTELVGAAHDGNLSGKDLSECYRAIVGEKSDELDKLKEMFNTEKGFFGGSDTAEYTAAKTALDNYIRVRGNLKEGMKLLPIACINDNGAINVDNATKSVLKTRVAELKSAREACEDLMKTYITKKTNGTIETGKNNDKKHYNMGDKGIDNMVQGAGSARLASAVSILEVLRGQRGSSAKTDKMTDKQKEMKTKATTFAKLYAAEMKSKGADRRKASENALKTMKEKNKTKNKTNNKGKSI